MSRAPARRPSSPSQAPAPGDQCPRNDDCQMRSTLALESIAAGLEAAMPSIKAAGAVFARWERACVWVRTRAPKHGWWVVPVLWLVSNFVSPELKVAIQNALTVVLNNFAAGGAG